MTVPGDLQAGARVRAFPPDAGQHASFRNGAGLQPHHPNRTLSREAAVRAPRVPQAPRLPALDFNDTFARPVTPLHQRHRRPCPGSPRSLHAFRPLFICAEQTPVPCANSF